MVFRTRKGTSIGVLAYRLAYHGIEFRGHQPVPVLRLFMTVLDLAPGRAPVRVLTIWVVMRHQHIVVGFGQEQHSYASVRLSTPCASPNSVNPLFL